MDPENGFGFEFAALNRSSFHFSSIINSVLARWNPRLRHSCWFLVYVELP